MVTMLSGVIVIHVVSCPLAAASAETSEWRPGANVKPATPSRKPPPATVPAPMKARRDHFLSPVRFAFFAAATSVMGHLGATRRLVDRRAHAREGSASADFRDAGVDLAVRGIGNLRQQSGDGHDDARLAVTALWHLVFDPGLLHSVQRAVDCAIRREPLDRL